MKCLEIGYMHWGLNIEASGTGVDYVLFVPE